MRVVAVEGSSEAETAVVVEELTSRLAARGPVGTVTRAESEPSIDGEGGFDWRQADAVRSYGLGDDRWIATGESPALEDALDDLATSCDFAVVAGFEGTSLSTVVIDGANAEADDEGDRVLARAASAGDLDYERVVAGLADVDPYVTLEALVERVKGAPGTDRAGAIATFTGRVRRQDHPDDVPTEYLAFERYDEVAEAKTAAIREDLRAREGVHEVLLHHKTGVVEAGEDIVFVVVLAGHREEAFRAVEDGIDRLKAEVPLFKKEVTVDDEFWAHERRS